MKLPTTPAAWNVLANHVADDVLGPPSRALPELIGEVSRLYTRDRDQLDKARGRDVLTARLRFFLTRDVKKMEAPMEELAFADALPKTDTWRVLDLGAGLGTTTLGLAPFAEAAGATIDVLAIDADALALKGMAALCREVGIEQRGQVGDAVRIANGTKLDHEAPFDFIVLGLFLNELSVEKRRTLVDSLKRRLAPNGSLIIIEPALREVTRELHELRRDWITSGWTVFAPCLHALDCPMLEGERDWCHEDRAFRLPDPLIPVARAASLRFESITFAYLTLRKDGQTLAGALHPEDERVVSQVMVSKGKKQLFVCSGGKRSKWVRLDRKRSPGNEAFDALRRGSIVRSEGLVSKGDGLRIEETSVLTHTPLQTLAAEGRGE
ncbi:MAG: SAM-dependent methyltransferase [Polyangiales bacterium]|jgi:SAM-dependent methyltransferase